VRRGGKVTVRGIVEAFTNSAVCAQGVSVALQRRNPGSIPYRTFALRATSASGRFSLTFKPTRTQLYRALVAESAACLGAASDREKISVRRR
jgi:hypothetical protein